MTTPNNNFPNYSVPQRTSKVTDLIQMLAISIKDYIDSGEKDQGERNIILAMCEICISVPPMWFATPERLLIVGTIQNLYGDPHDFINEIDEGTISFYNKFAAENPLPLPEERSSLEALIATLHRLHEKEFGAVN
jgi:hypothetical protein